MHPQNDASVAQLVEHLTLNQGVQGSTPCGSTAQKAVGSTAFFVSMMVLSKKMTIIAISNKQNHHIMKKSSLLRALALFTLILVTGCFAHAQIKITPVDPNTASASSSNDHKTVFKCIATTTCSINDKNELVNCEQKEETTTFVLEASKGTITIIKPLKRQTYYIEAFEHEETTGTLELQVYDDSGVFLQNATITIFAGNNLISVQRDLGFDEYDDSWNRETAMSRIGGTMEIYDIEH